MEFELQNWNIFAGKIHGVFHLESHEVSLENFTCLLPYQNSVQYETRTTVLQDRQIWYAICRCLFNQGCHSSL